MLAWDEGKQRVIGPGKGKVESALGHGGEAVGGRKGGMVGVGVA